MGQRRSKRTRDTTDLLDEARQQFATVDEEMAVSDETDGHSPSDLDDSSSDLDDAVVDDAEEATSSTSSKRATSSRVKSSRTTSSRIGLGRKAGGVAPFVAPPSRFARWRHLSGWRRQGFVPLSPGREKRRHRILPRTVIGICTMLMSAGIGAGFSGAAFYAYYDDRLAENEEQVAGFVETFDTQFADAALAIEGQRDAALDDVRAELLPLEAYVADANGVATLPDTAGPSVWSIRTLDDAGRSTSGTAFAVVDHLGGVGLITQLDIVQAATVSPAPPIELVKGDRVITATLWAWDDANGLALVVTEEPLPLLSIADADRSDTLIGRSVFAMSGVGGRGATASPGLMLDRSVQGVQHTAAVGPVFEGGPVVDGLGEVLAMTTGSSDVFGDISVAIDASVFCERVLRCVNGLEAGTN